MKSRISRIAPALSTALIALSMSACASHIAPYKPKHRNFDPGEYAASTGSNKDGSLYSAGADGLYEDGVAGRIGDIVVILIDEHEDASRDAATTLSKTDTTSYGVTALLGLLPALQKAAPGVDPSQLFGTNSSMQFAGAGSSTRKGTLTATLPVRVAQVLPNHDLYVEGHKVVMVGEEEHHLYISGIVRRRDIADDDSIPSSRIAEAQIEYTGKGDVSDQQRRGWLSRLIAKVWPF